MGAAAIIAIAQAIIAGGVQLEPIIAGLIAKHQDLATSGRPDVTDADLDALIQLIKTLQDHINQNAGIATGGPVNLVP